MSKMSGLPVFVRAVLDNDVLQAALRMNRRFINSVVSDVSLLMYAANNANIPMLQLLLDNGADVNYVNCFDSTVLHKAVQTGNSDVIEFLLSAGAYVNVENDDGLTPFSMSLVLMSEDPSCNIPWMMLEKSSVDPGCGIIRNSHTVLDFVIQEYNFAIEDGDKVAEEKWDAMYDKLHELLKDLRK